MDDVFVIRLDRKPNLLAILVGAVGKFIECISSASDRLNGRGELLATLRGVVLTPFLLVVFDGVFRIALFVLAVTLLVAFTTDLFTLFDGLNLGILDGVFLAGEGTLN